MKITMYLEVSSSWCFWAEPAWEEIKRRYEGRATFDWKIALMPLSAQPVSAAQRGWFYRRSGTIMGSSFALNPDWAGKDVTQSFVPNFVAEASRSFPGTGELVRLALSRAALLKGRPIWSWDVAADVAVNAVPMARQALLARANSSDVEARVRATTAEFDALQVTQRPAFVLENDIGDRAVFSGIVKWEPLAAAMDAMLSDEAAYVSYTAHFGNPPPG